MPDVPTASAPASALSKGRVFASRLGSTLALWALVTGAIVAGRGYLFFIVLGVLGMAGLREFTAMDRTLPNPWRYGLLAVALGWFNRRSTCECKTPASPSFPCSASVSNSSSGRVLQRK